LALRGSSDYEPLTLNQPMCNDGNFRALLRLCLSCGDKHLTEHIQGITGIDEENKSSSYILREDFVKFVAVHNTTGMNLATVMLKSLQALGVYCTYLVGQGYDGITAMSGSFKGVQAIIKEKYPAAI
ncbi:hypothetical protein CBL_21282, partial [Carabus blaptoides fortunei]